MYWNPNPRTPHLSDLRHQHSLATDMQERADLATRIRWIETAHEHADAYKACPVSPLAVALEALWTIS